MFATQELNSLAARKQQLLLTSRLQRQVLAVQVAQFRESAGWIERGYGLAQSLRPALKIGLPLAGLLLFRKRAASKSFALRVLGGWQIARKCLGIWRSLRVAEK